MVNKSNIIICELKLYDWLYDVFHRREKSNILLLLQRILLLVRHMIDVRRKYKGDPFETSIEYLGGETVNIQIELIRGLREVKSLMCSEKSHNKWCIIY